MSLRAIVLSGQMGAKILASRVIAIVSLGPVSYRAKLAELPAWYDLVTLSESPAMQMTGGFSDGVSVSDDGFVLAQGREFSESVTASEGVVTEFDFFLSPSETITIADIFACGMPPAGSKWINGNTINSTTLG